MYRYGKLNEEITNLKPGDFVEVTSYFKESISENYLEISNVTTVSEGYLLPHLEIVFTNGTKIVVPKYKLLF